MKIERPSPSWAARALKRILDAQEWPWTKLLVLAVTAGLFVYGQVDLWYLAPRREAARDREQKIREGRYFSPTVELIPFGDRCMLRNADARSITEATVAWRIFKITVAGTPGYSGRGQVVADSHELKPREALSGLFPVEGNPFCNGDTSECAPGKCVVLAECIATYHRQADTREYSDPVLVQVVPQAKGCILVPLSLNEVHTDENVNAALALFPAFRKDWDTLITTKKFQTYQHGGNVDDAGR